MLEVRKFDLHEHYPIFAQWRAERRVPVIEPEDLTDTGFLILSEGKPILCGFAILTNARFVMLDIICSNPETSWEDREDAMLLLTKAIEMLATNLGYKRVLGFTDFERLAEKVRLAGWTVDNKMYFAGVKELNHA